MHRFTTMFEDLSFEHCNCGNKGKDKVNSHNSKCKYLSVVDSYKYKLKLKNAEKTN